MPQSIRAATLTRAAVFTPLHTEGRAELVEQRLSDAIVSGVLPDGERLPSELELAKQLGVAVVTARESLEALRSRGLVTTRRGRDGGSFVTFSGHARHDILDKRVDALARSEIRDMGVHYSAIAGMAAELAADRAGPLDVETLRTITSSFDVSEEGAARRALSRFQLELAALSQSARLVREELRLQAEFGPVLWLCLSEPEHRERSLDVLRTVTAAVEAVDPDAARRESTRHIAMAVDWLVARKSMLAQRHEKMPA